MTRSPLLAIKALNELMLSLTNYGYHPILKYNLKNKVMTLQCEMKEADIENLEKQLTTFMEK
ncbi:hypothetical protein KKF82_08000 [Patescibacteria group bacterium]|uniref:Uncharacterized protein n=1 Tax=viral metagenome TaxID=1070528 RepID=A0A6M3MD13_9ZZZZ|nr:hypothetical protein [Patescibacteria group bacterium]